MNELQQLSNATADAVERVAPSLVTVEGRRRLAASGVAVDGDRVLTADHVLERDEDLAVVAADGRRLEAQLAGRDPSTDLALLTVPGLGAQAANPADARVGQLVLAVGRPPGEGVTASLGVISSAGGPLRTRRGTLERYLRTDAEPYPGLSGGALIDSGGAVVGLFTTGLAGGVPLAIPADLAWSLAGSLAEHGQVRRPYLGIRSQPVALPPAQQAALGRQVGLLLVEIEPGSPAADAGLIVGDILVGFKGSPITQPDDVQALLGESRVGDATTIDILRGGSPLSLPITLRARIG